MNLPFGIGTTPTTPTPTQPSIPPSAVPMPFGLTSAPTVSASTPLPFGLKSSTPVPPTPSADNTPDALKPTASILRAAVGGIKQATDNATAPSFNPLDWAKAAENAYSSAINEAGNRVAEAHDNWKSDSSLGKVKDVGLAAIGGIGAILSPISAVFKAAEGIPVIGRAAVAVNALFGAIGNGSGEAANQILQSLPIPQDVKDTLSPLVKEAGGLAGQILTGKAGIDEVGSLADKTREILSNIKDKIKVEVPTKVPVQSTTGETPIQINTPPKTQVPVRSETPNAEPVNVNTPYKAPEELPVIQMGAKPKETLPVIQTEPPASNRIGSMRYGPLPDEQSKVYYHATSPDSAAQIESAGFKTEKVPLTTDKAQALEQANGNSAGVVEVRVKDGAQQIPANSGAPLYLATDVRPVKVGLDTVSPKPIEGTGGVKTRGLSAGVEASAVKNKLTTGFGDLPEYKTMNIEEQSTRAADLVNKDYETAKKVAMGDAPTPQGLHPEAVYTAVELRATKEGDVNLLRDLATRSILPTEATTMGQRIKLLDERNPDSPVKAIRDVAKAREAKVAKLVKDISKTKKDIASEIDQSIKSIRPKKQSWTEFVRSIQC